MNCTLAPNASTLVESLFTPGGTPDGFIRKKSKRSVDFFAFGHELTLNTHGVVCHRSKQPDGDWPEPYARILTDAAEVFGECNLYVGDDGKLYL